MQQELNQTLLTQLLLTSVIVALPWLITLAPLLNAVRVRNDSFPSS